MKKRNIIMLVIITLFLVGCGSKSNNGGGLFGNTNNNQKNEENENTNINNDSDNTIEKKDNTTVNNNDNSIEKKDNTEENNTVEKNDNTNTNENTNVNGNNSQIDQNKSKEEQFIETAYEFIEATKTKVEDGSHTFYNDSWDDNVLFLIPVGNKHYSAGGFSCVETKSGGASPYSDSWNYAFVGVTYDRVGWTYFFIAEDASGHGISFVTYDEIKNINNAVKYIYSSTSDKAYSESISGKKAAMNRTLHDNLVRVYRTRASRWYSDKPTEYSKIPESGEMVKLASLVDRYYDKEYIAVDGSCD